MRPKSRDEFMIAIICALPFEADAVEALFDETYDHFSDFYGKNENDENVYVNGRLGNHNIVLCYLPGIGKVGAASVASDLRVSYSNVHLALVVGVCGGAPYTPDGRDIYLGDVIISNTVVEADLGRKYPGKFERRVDTLRTPHREMRTLLAAFQASRSSLALQNKVSMYHDKICQSNVHWRRPSLSDDILYESSHLHRHYKRDTPASCCCIENESSKDICQQAIEATCTQLGCDRTQVRRRRRISAATKVAFHVGRVASTDTVMKSAESRDELIQRDGVIGFEMESAGVWNNITCVVIKGVCDYADSHKNKAWQSYAAGMSASVAKALLGCLNGYPVRTDIKYQIQLQQSSDIKDIQSLIAKINKNSQAKFLFFCLVFFYVRKRFLANQRQLPKEVGLWQNLPAFLEDAHLRRFPVPLETINTWEILDFVLESQFCNMPGYQKVKDKSYYLQDSVTRKEVQHGKNFRAYFRPGRCILMSMVFRRSHYEESSCPSCHAVNADSGVTDVCCSSCGTQYRRVAEVTGALSSLIHESSKNCDDCTPSLPVYDSTDDDIADFKRVRIVAVSNARLKKYGRPAVPKPTYSYNDAMMICEATRTWGADKVYYCSQCYNGPKLYGIEPVCVVCGQKALPPLSQDGLFPFDY